MKDRPEESIEKKEVLPKASSTPMMKNKDDEMKEKIQEKISATAPPPPSPPLPQGKGQGRYLIGMWSEKTMEIKAQ